MKQLCPHCYKSVSIPEEAAGTNVPCPECGEPFAVPRKYNPTVGPAPAVPPPPVADPAVVPPPPEPPGYTHSRGFTLSPAVVAWIPTVALTTVLLFTFVPWVELAPGGHTVYAQGVWRGITGRPKCDFQLESLLLKDLPAPSLYDRTPADWYILLPYLFVVLIGAALAWSDRLDAKAVADRLPWLWPHRTVVLAGLAGAAFLLLAIESARGFGLERALNAAVSEKFSARREQAGNVAGEQKKIDFEESQELAKYGLERSGMWLALGLHGLALAAMLVKFGLDRRGDKPPPRIAIHY